MPTAWDNGTERCLGCGADVTDRDQHDDADCIRALHERIDRLELEVYSHD